MAFTIEDLLADVRSSRKFLLKHLVGVRDDQVDWKPYPECKSIREIVVHLLSGERASQESLKTGSFPDYDTIQAHVSEEAKGKSLSQLLAALATAEDTTHRQITDQFGNTPLGEDVTFWGRKNTLGSTIAHFTSEDYYHSGQIAFIRMATDTNWDYYGSIYFSD